VPEVKYTSIGSSERVGSASGGASLAASSPASQKAQPGAAPAVPSPVDPTAIRVRSTPSRAAAWSTLAAPSGSVTATRAVARSSR
jgi:hypothetical protein